MRAAAVALCICASLLPGCALMGPSALEEGGAGVMRSGTPAPSAAQALVPPGSSKAQVAAALGRANTIRFDTGWEVWVYRWPGADRSTRGATELVVLFDAQGLVKKSRIRPGVRA